MSKDSHPVETQLQEMTVAKQISDQLEGLIGHYMQGEMDAQRNPGENEIFQKISYHMVELQGNLADMVVGLKKAQATRNAEEELQAVLKDAQTKASDPDLPF